MARPKGHRGPMPKQLVGKGFDGHPEHINRNGRPRSFDELRKLILEIGSEEIEGTVGKGKLRKKLKLSRIEMILYDWFFSQSWQKQQLIIQYGFGKVPDKLDVSGLKDIHVTLKKADAENS